ncbi:sugar ABC transporter ATP-binding protein [Devosia sp.]|uniref:sugar ABC transporter ATP-binding protein n=1 Tax=Devosia sp. TaxID=1871048 RepID=UPI003A8ED3F7
MPDPVAELSAPPRSVAQPFLRLTSVRKTYPGVVALAGVDMSVAPGEVIGLVGENGAGKSTLMKILGGVIQPDSGTIEIDGTALPGLTVSGSMRAGIAFVHQELNLFDNLDVASNVFIGREPLTGGPLKLVDTRKMRADVAPYLEKLGASFTPSTPTARLSLAQQQLVEIAKALSVNARLVILDEPTSSLPVAETDRLIEVIAGLKAAGIAVIFITHRLGEITRSCDRVLVLRDGVQVGTLDKAEITHDNMVRLMIGRALRVEYDPPKAARGGALLSARGIRTTAHPGRDVDLDLHAGEILGLAGLVGSGRTEFARVLFGIDRANAGTLQFDGAPLTLHSASDAVKHGIYLVPEDRKGAGILLDLPIAENISLPNLPSLSPGGLVSASRERQQAEQSRTELSIKAPTVQTRTGSLSGGNQQKVVLAKWLAMRPRALIFDEPTRGIDVGAKAEIYRLMRGLADSGVAVLMISSDMEEVIGVSDRIAVMHEGHISGQLERADFSEENVLSLAIGKPLASAGRPQQDMTR